MKGLWGSDSKKRPGSMTQFILDRGLLPAGEVADIIEQTPKEIVSYQEGYARGEDVPPFDAFMAQQLVQIEGAQ